MTMEIASSPERALPGAPLDAEGVWCEVRTGRGLPPGPKRPALFLDRDGTLINLVPYLSRPELVKPVPGLSRVIARANALAIPVVVITNQSGIARGYYGWRDFAAVQAALDGFIRAGGGRIDAVYACPHLPGALLTTPGEDPPSRKPNPGMLLRAREDLNLDLAASWIVGDAASDLEAGKRAGLSRGWLVPTGLGTQETDAARQLADARFEVVVEREFRMLGGELRSLAEVTNRA